MNRCEEIVKSPYLNNLTDLEGVRLLIPVAVLLLTTKCVHSLRMPLKLRKGVVL